MNVHDSGAGEGHATYDRQYTAYQFKRSNLRRWIRRYYLLAASQLSAGPALDFGCGIGDLLKRLPPGSIGIEYNLSTVEYCRRQQLNVIEYDGFKDDFGLTGIPWRGEINTLFLSHVLEHFDDPAHVLRKLAKTTGPDIKRIVVIVPGKAGYQSDSTHRTFVDLDLLKNTVGDMHGWSIKSSRYFPFNQEWVGNYFVHNELQVVIDRTSTA